MKTKTVLTILAVITLSIGMLVFTHSQTNNLVLQARRRLPVFSTPQNLGATVNSPGTENSAFVAPNGLSLYFSGNRPGGLGQGDIWVSQRETLTSAWGTTHNLETFNTSSLENQPHLSLDGLTMFFNSGKPGGFGSQDIYISTRTNPNDDFGWTDPVNLGPIVNTRFAEMGAGYFEDPITGIATLYFASDRPGGFGAADIYQSTRNADGTFDPPTNVLQLNSVALDGYPKLSRDGLEIFFHSERQGGLGGMDIWVSSRASTRSRWRPPVNLTSLNTNGFDATPSVSPDGSMLYFASDRAGGFGAADLYTAVRIDINCR